MNFVEQWFSALTTKILQCSMHRSLKALAEGIEAWPASWNENSNRLVWRRNTDEILERLAGFCSAPMKNLVFQTGSTLVTRDSLGQKTRMWHFDSFIILLTVKASKDEMNGNATSFFEGVQLPSWLIRFAEGFPED